MAKKTRRKQILQNLHHARRRRDRAERRQQAGLLAWLIEGLFPQVEAKLKGLFRVSDHGMRGRYVVVAALWHSPSEYAEFRAYGRANFGWTEEDIGGDPPGDDVTGCVVGSAVPSAADWPPAHSLVVFWLGGIIRTYRLENSSLEFSDASPSLLTLTETLEEVGVSYTLYEKLRLAAKDVGPDTVTGRGYFFGPDKIQKIKGVLAEYQRWGPELRPKPDPQGADR